MQNKIHISVILPVYNAESYVEQAIQSILQQTYPHFELLLINDGSTDNSEAICLTFNDARLVYIKNEKNLGLIATLNKGLKLAKGTYIARMDADDVSLPERFAKQVKVFETHSDALVVSSDHYAWNGKQTLTRVYNQTESDVLKSTLLFATCFCHPTVMMKNVFQHENGLYSETAKHVEDYKLWMDLSFRGAFYNVNEPLLKYRSHTQQVSVLHHRAQIENSNQLRQHFLNQLGFTVTLNELELHNSIGNNEFITSAKHLKAIEHWLIQLAHQNTLLQRFNAEAFQNTLHKFWMDSCGYTSLGLYAYQQYKASPLRNNIKVSQRQLFKLMAKCFIRQFVGYASKYNTPNR